jgi:hypothetical protein
MAGMLAAPIDAYSQTSGMERRGDVRDNRQDGRQEGRGAKQACKASGDKRSECRQEKRNTKQDARGDARDTRRGNWCNCEIVAPDQSLRAAIRITACALRTRGPFRLIAGPRRHNLT